MWDTITNKDVMSMMFVEKINKVMDTPGKYNWWKLSEKKRGELQKFTSKLDWFKMTEEEKVRIRKFADNFNWPDDDPDWMEKEE